MKQASIFAMTGVVTGLHNFYWLMAAVYGAPINVLNLTAILGAAVLLIAASILPFRPQFGARVGFAGSLLSWVFYAPSIIVGLVAPHSAWQEIRFFFKLRDYVPLVGTIFGPVLLIASTVISIRRLRHGETISPTIHP